MASGFGARSAVTASGLAAPSRSAAQGLGHLEVGRRELGTVGVARLRAELEGGLDLVLVLLQRRQLELPREHRQVGVARHLQVAAAQQPFAGPPGLVGTTYSSGSHHGIACRANRWRNTEVKGS